MFKYLNKQIKELDLWDIGLTKWSVFFITILLVKFFPQLLKINSWVLLVLGLAMAARPTYRMFKAR